ncbi:MAG TPA: serine/threonine-protein kinase [Micromonosporaceae bacterium]
MTTQSPWLEQSPSGNPPTEDRATPGTVVGSRYELIEAIGHGGMGTVWRSTDTLLHREVAVKEVILPPTMPQAEKDALCERTMREARAAAALAHPSVVQVYDVVTDANRPWIVMELLQARSLADMVIDDGPLPPRAVAKIGIAMLGALEVAHAAGVLHRDVKPANVLISSDGRCVLTDFGVARLPTESKLTTPGMVLGSPHFISPERAVGGSFGPPSDLFSLGVTLYTAVEGGPPFDRGDPFETMRAVVEEAPRPARLAGPLKPILWGLLEKEPDRRWDVERARTALRELLSGPLAARTPGSAKDALSARPARDATDPVAVLRPPRAQAPAGPPPAIVNETVGGRAMLDPNEPLTDQLARLRAEAGLGPEDDRGGERLTPDDVTRRIPATRDTSTGRGRPRATGVGERPHWADSSWAQSWGGSGAAGAAHRRAGTARRSRAGDPGRDHIGRRRAPSLVSRVWDRMRAGRNRVWVPVAAGVVTLGLALGIAAAAGAFSGGHASAPPDVGATSVGPSAPFEVQEYRDRGIAVNVPAGWTRADSQSSYVDFKDPQTARWVRINIEQTSLTAKKLLQNAESGLKDPTRCAAPYKRVALHDAELGGLAGAELEYTCGSGATERHGIWRAVVRDGTAYHFYLTTPQAAFADSRAIYDEMVRSFQFG